MAPRRVVTDIAGWFRKHSAGAPEALRARVEQYLSAVPETASRAETLAAAANDALSAVVGKGRDRRAALDLLAADALVTLSLLAEAEEAPEALGRFAEHLVKNTIA